MKVKISIIDDKGRKFEGEAILAKKSSRDESDESQSFSDSNFKGLKGGIELLISQGFLDNPKNAKEVTEELKKEGYFNQKEAVDTALRRDFVLKKKTLTRIKQDKLWHYVIRR